MKTLSLSVLLLSLSSVTGFSVQPPQFISSTALFSTPEASSASPAPAARNEASTNQPAYGVTLDLPGTYVRCGRCHTGYAIADTDLGTGKGRRVECSLCGHSWFQTPERLFTLNDGNELVPLPPNEIDRINSNIAAGRDANFIGYNKFYVGNLDFGVTEKDLWEVFREVGDVGAVSIVTTPEGQSRGFAFVTMMSDDVTEKCIALDGKEMKGRNINVKPPNN